MKELTAEELKQVEETEEHVAYLNLQTKVREIMTEELELNEDNFLKFNLPNTRQGFDSGNGEGVWGVPLTEEGQKIYDNDASVGETFEVILLNNSIYYPFPYGTILTVQTRGSNRPVIDYEWLDERVASTGEGATLADVLEDVE